MGTVAIVGGTGFLGRHVSPALDAEGWTVRALSRRNGFDGRLANPDAFRGCDAVVNLAGIKREEGTQTFQAVHVELVARLVESMKAAGVRRLVHISVVVARPAPEMPYHDTKWNGEQIVRASGLEWTILRPGVIYGVGDDMLTHLAKMINAAPFFPIVNDGGSILMPVHAGDVGAAVASALRREASVGKTYDVVGPDRLTLRTVVERVAAAADRPIRIVSTPVALMKGPVRIMEAVMKQPLSTRAQLAMLTEGLAGDPEPARKELGLAPISFETERIRSILDAGGLRLKREVPAVPAIATYILAAALMTFAFRGPLDPWKGMTVAMGVLLAASLAFRAVRSRLAPTPRRIGLGLGAAAALYGLTRLGILVLQRAWPGWSDHARTLTEWKSGHSPLFLGATLVLIVLAEEALWRGVVTRFAVEKLGRVFGVVVGAALYAAAHVETRNPLILTAAVGCGIVWGFLADATDDLTAPFVCHLAWDVLLLFVLPVV